MEIDYSTGKLNDVARRERGDRRREFRLFWIILLLASIPYAMLFCWRPWLALWGVFAAACFKVVQTFLTSSQTETAHHVRFLLAGSNPFGMTGGCSLLLGAVDSLLDWNEDRQTRRSGLVVYWVSTLAKFFATPLGVVLFVCEVVWDIGFARHGLRGGWRLARLKLQEFFSVAYFHDLVCPEKSNDIFYADLAIARFKNDPHLYQWQRLRAMVFEIEHYRLDVKHSVGDPNTNLFLQDEFTAYQSLRRLQLESLENAIEDHFDQSPELFPLPVELSAKLIRNARPIEHYLRIRAEQRATSEPVNALEHEFHQLLYPASGDPTDYYTWHVLRLMESESIELRRCRYFTETIVQAMTAAGIVEWSAAPGGSNASVRLTKGFSDTLRAFVDQHFEPLGEVQSSLARLQRQPRLLDFHGRSYRSRGGTEREHVTAS
jgi:hypothetical protein